MREPRPTPCIVSEDFLQDAQQTVLRNQELLSEYAVSKGCWKEAKSGARQKEDALNTARHEMCLET